MTKQHSENRKALPKFIGTVILSALIGGVVGLLAGFTGATNLPETIVSFIYNILTAVTPWSIPAVTAVCLAVGMLRYHSAKKLADAWDGENEEIIEKAEQQLCWILFYCSLNMVVDFFFFGIGFQLLAEGRLWFVLSFVLSLGCCTVLQQKVVDLTRKINPEKQGSIYDKNFQKKWFASCDENEQRQIGQAAFKAFNAVNSSCVILWMILVILTFVFDIGILPIFLVTLIFGISQAVYVLESIRMGRDKRNASV